MLHCCAYTRSLIYQKQLICRIQQFILSLILVFFVTVCWAQEPSKVKTGSYLDARGPYDPRPFKGTHFVDSFILGDDYFSSKNQRWKNDDFAIGGYISLNVQLGSEDNQLHGMSESLLIGAWEPLRNENEAGRLVFGIAHDHTVGSLTTREFSDRQGLVETTDDLDTSPDKTFTTLGLLAWEHEFYTGPNQGWGYRAGQLFAAGYFGSAVYLDDDRQFFMARPLATAAGAQWVGNNDIGLGANLVFWQDAYYVSVAALDGKANRKYPQFDSLLDGELLYLAEAGFERDLGGPNEAILRITASHLDLSGQSPEEGPGQSLMLSAEHQFDGKFATFMRWSKSYKRLTSDYQELLSMGIALLQPFGFSQDLLGFGVFVGDPSSPEKAYEYGAELSYKLQLTQDISVMPDLQYWYRNDSSAQRISSWVTGVRLNFEF